MGSSKSMFASYCWVLTTLLSTTALESQLKALSEVVCCGVCMLVVQSCQQLHFKKFIVTNLFKTLGHWFCQISVQLKSLCDTISSKVVFLYSSDRATTLIINYPSEV